MRCSPISTSAAFRQLLINAPSGEVKSARSLTFDLATYRALKSRPPSSQIENQNAGYVRLFAHGLDNDCMDGNSALDVVPVDHCLCLRPFPAQGTAGPNEVNSSCLCGFVGAKYPLASGAHLLHELFSWISA